MGVRGNPAIYLFAVALAAACCSAFADTQPAPAQVQSAPAAATRPSPTCCCAAACPREAEKKTPWYLDSAIITAVIGFIIALGKYIHDSWRKKRTLNTIILAEIARLLEVTVEHKSWWERMIEKKDTNQQLIPFTTPIFDSQMANLGDLDRRYAGDIVRFYGYMKFLNTKQQTQPHPPKRGKTAEFDQSYLNSLDRLLKSYRPKLEPALEKYHIDTKL